MVNFIKKYHFNNELAQLVSAKNKFETQEDTNEFDVLIEQCNDIKKLDKLIADIEPDGYKVPILLKKYISQNAQIIGFNVDRDFNNSLDGLMILDLKQLPENSTYKKALTNIQ